MKPLGLGIIGLHHQHPRWYHPLWAHLPQYRPLAIADPDAEHLRAENEFFALDAYSDYSDLLGRDDIDVVIVWTPHSEMPDVVAASAAAGKHVIVEKPCAADVEGAERIVRTAAEHPQVKISSPYCWRTHPVTAEIRRAVTGGLLGEITAMEGRLNAGGAWRYVRDNARWMLKRSEGGGPMWNLGVHWIDYFRWMTGREVTAVCGAVSGPTGEGRPSAADRVGDGDPPRDIEDNAQAVLTFDGGATGILDISYALPDSYPGKRDIYVAFRGTLGDAVWAPAWEGVTDELLLVSEHESMGDERVRRITVTSQDVPGYCGHMAWAWLADFADAVRRDRPPVVSPADMLAAVRVADAFYRSVDSGRREEVRTA